MRKLSSLGQLGGNDENNKEKHRAESLNKGFTKLEANRGRWETLLDVLGETRPADGRIQVYIIKELQKELIALVRALGIQSVFTIVFSRIHKSNMTKTRRDLQEAEESAKKIWELHKQMVKFIYYEGKIILQRQKDGKIMKGIGFSPPDLFELVPRVGLPEEGFDGKSTELFKEAISDMIGKVKEFHKTFGHPIGSAVWGHGDGPPGGLNKHRILLRTSLIREEFQELSEGCRKGDWVEIMDGIGDLEYVILGSVVELGITIDILLQPEMDEGKITLDLRSTPREIRQ